MWRGRGAGRRGPRATGRSSEFATRVRKSTCPSNFTLSPEASSFDSRSRWTRRSPKTATTGRPKHGTITMELSTDQRSFRPSARISKVATPSKWAGAISQRMGMAYSWISPPSSPSCSSGCATASARRTARPKRGNSSPRSTHWGTKADIWNGLPLSPGAPPPGRRRRRDWTRRGEQSESTPRSRGTRSLSQRIHFGTLRILAGLDLTSMDREPEGQFLPGDVPHRDEKLTDLSARRALDRERLLDLTLGHKIQVFEDLAEKFMRPRCAFHLILAPKETSPTIGSSSHARP